MDSTIYLLIILVMTLVWLVTMLVIIWKRMKRERVFKANPGLYSAHPDTVLRRQIRQEMDRSKQDMIFVADEWHMLKRPFIDLNDFEYEMQDVLAKHFDLNHILYFYKNGKKYKIVFDETERMVQEVVDE